MRVQLHMCGELVGGYNTVRLLVESLKGSSLRTLVTSLLAARMWLLQEIQECSLQHLELLHACGLRVSVTGC